LARRCTKNCHGRELFAIQLNSANYPDQFRLYWILTVDSYQFPRRDGTEHYQRARVLP